MADNPTTTLRVLDALENVVAGSGKVRTTDLGAPGHVQHVRLDLGSGTSEAQATATVPVSGTLTTKGETGSASDPGSTGTVDQTANGTEVLAANALRKGLFLWFDQDVRLLFSTGNVSATTSYLWPAYAPMNFPLASGYVYVGAIKALALTATPVNYYRAEFQ